MAASTKYRGALMLDLSGLALTLMERRLLARPVVGGVILFARNYRSKAQLKKLIAEIRECNNSILIAVDQEGGRVQRFRDDFLTLPALFRIGELARTDLEKGCMMARSSAWVMASELRAVGVDFSFAPVLDLFSVNSNVIGDRGFSDDPELAIILASEYINGMHEAGMAATGKHFPGHGTVTGDSHLELPVDRRTFDQIKKKDLKVFAQTVNLVDAIMPAHVLYPEVDALSAGFSTYWLQQVLRKDLNFRGVIFSDDLTMLATESSGGIERRAQLALDAGCEMILVCNDTKSAMRVADFLEAVNLGESERLGQMVGRTFFELDNLYESERWQIESKVIYEFCSQEEFKNE
jgi:beta-N-acetylhexosaminidase